MGEILKILNLQILVFFPVVFDIVSNHADFLHSVQILSRLSEQNDSKQCFNDFMSFQHRLSKKYHIDIA